MHIKGTLGRDWKVKTLYVYWETNCVVDWLTNYELTRDLIDKYLNVLTEPPSEFYTLLYYDLIRSIISSLI